MKKLIGIAGHARSGKDTVGNFIKENFQRRNKDARVVSFAHCLRQELDSFCLDNLGISAFTTDDNEKKLIRPLLVCWGTEIRRNIDEDYWIRSLEQTLNDSTQYIITDLRFENEHRWIKSNGGITLYLDREQISPANQYEKENNAILAKIVDYVWHMPTTRDIEVLKQYTEKKCLHSFENLI
jgi:hypothetical protein